MLAAGRDVGGRVLDGFAVLGFLDRELRYGVESVRKVVAEDGRDVLHDDDGRERRREVLEDGRDRFRTARRGADGDQLLFLRRCRRHGDRKKARLATLAAFHVASPPFIHAFIIRGNGFKHPPFP